jgi:diguanylate cyclase (GGDEF)-like protein
MASESNTPAADRRLMVRSAAAMFAAAAFLGIVEGFTPGGPHFSPLPGFAAFGLVPLILVLGHRVPQRALAGLGLLGVAMIADALATTHGYGDGAVLYVWPVLWVARFYGRGPTVLIVAGIAVAHGYSLSQMPPGVGYFDRWLDVMVSVCIVAAVVRVLTERNDNLVAGLLAEARVDSLTGLLNRRGFDERVPAELARVRRAGSSVAVVSFDVDHFSGSTTGPGTRPATTCSSRVGATLRDHARASDLVARVGGEEFVTLMPGCDAVEARGFAERIRVVMESEPPAGTPPATVSAGVAAATAPSDLLPLLRASDAALYAAKRAGRNRVSEAAAQTPDRAAV